MTLPPTRLRVIADYEAPYPDPIRVRAGEIVAVDPEKKTNIAGWLWCTGKAGKSGWVPEAYLDRSGNTARLRGDYDAVELTIRVGNLLTAHKLESGFYWATDRNGRQGWVPAEHVELIPAGKSETK
jgi:hypothetical protein